MVEVVVEMIIFRKAPQIAILHFVEISDFGSSDRWHVVIIKIGATNLK